VPLILDEAKDCDAPACAPVYRGEELVGLVTSGGYGHTIGKSIALAYVRTDLAKIGQQLEIEVFGDRRKAVVSPEPIFDPENARLRA
jgi:dimethylglycine dehydrogenase